MARARRRLLQRTLAGAGASLVFVAALSGGVLLHVGTPPARRIAAWGLSDLLTRTFQGRIVIEHIDYVDFGGFEGASATVYDPEGERVLDVTGLKGRSSLVALARTLAMGRDIQVLIPYARAQHVDVTIRPDAEGIPSLAHAFTPRPSSSPSSGPGPQVHVMLPRIEMATACARGSVLGISNLDVDLANITGSVFAGTDRTQIVVNRYSVNARGITPAAAQGTAATRIEIPSITGQAVSLWTTFDGYLGDVQLNARLGLDGKTLEISGDTVRARPGAVRALWAPWPLQDEATVHFEAKGVPPHLAAKGTAEVGTGSADFEGELGFEEGLHTHLMVNARRVDLRSIFPTAPATEISASGHVSVSVKGELGVTGLIAADTQPFRIEGIDVPPASVNVALEGPHASGQVVVRDPALRADIDFDLHPGQDDGPLVVDLDWRAQVPEMDRVPWLAPIGHGQARWHAKARIVEGRVDARVDGTLERVTRPVLGLEQAKITGSLRGPLAGPTLSASLNGKGLRAGALYFPDVQATAQGPLGRLAVTTTVSGENAPKFTARASVERTRGGTALRDLEITAQRDDVAISGKVGAIEVTDDRVDLRAIAIEGAGQPITGSISVSPARVRVQASSGELDLKKLAAIFLPGFPVAGHLAFDIDAELQGQNEGGHARLHLTDGNFAGISGITAQAEAASENRRFSGGAEVKVGELGSLTATTVDANLAGPMLRGSSWTDATGRLDMNMNVDLDRVGRDLPELLGRYARTGGEIHAKLVLSREDLEAHRHHAPLANLAPPPNIELLLWTAGLRAEIASKVPLPKEKAAPVFSTDGVDVQLGLHADGETEHAELTARLVDRQGIFVGVTTLGKLPLRDLWAHPDEMADRLARLPVTAQITMPRRALSSYPEFVRLPDVGGELEAIAAFRGSLRSPSLAVTVRGYGVQPSTDVFALPVDFDAQGTYDGQRAMARVQARRPEGIVLDALTEITAPLDRLIGDGQEGPRWEASGSAQLVSFPLTAIPALVETQVAGLASGRLKFSGINRDPEINAELELRDLQLEKALFPRGIAVIRIAKGVVVASAKLEQPEGGGGSATASAGVRWNSPVGPQIDPAKPLDFFAEGHDFRAAALYPFLFRDIFTYFDGRINGTLHLHQESEEGAISQTVDGAFTLHDGVLQIPEVGQEFHKARASITVRKGGEVEISDVSASGVTGRLTAAGKIRLKGFAFESGEGTVRIARHEAVPLTLEGVSLGEAWGTLFLHAKMADEHRVKLDLDVPVFHADLPESSSRDVQGLATHPEVKVGVRGREGELSPVLIGAPERKREGEALAWHVTFYLGEDVRIRRGSTMEIVLGGRPVVDLTDEAHVSGSVDFRSGTVEVFGKEFEIEHGFAKFEGDEPGNPYVSVTARWDAPDGTRIFADFVGPLRTGVLNFRSQPALPQGQIMAALLGGGTGERLQGAPSGPQLRDSRSETAGVVVAGSAITMNVNRVISHVTPLDITTRVTHDAQSPTPEVEIRLAPKVTAEISYRTRTPMPGEQTDRVLLTLDWRFRRNWSIATTVGTRGSSVLDLIWKYRY